MLLPEGLFVLIPKYSEVVNVHPDNRTQISSIEWKVSFLIVFIIRLVSL